MAIPKKQFRDMAEQMIKMLTDMPDDLWNDTYPLIRIGLRTPDGLVTTIVVGLEIEDQETVSFDNLN